MQGTSATTLDPTGPATRAATRAQLAQFLKNLDRVLEEGKEPDPTPTPEPTATPTATPIPSDVFPLSMKKPLPIVAGPNQTLAINPDGTVRAVGLNEGGGLNVGGWTDIVSLSSLKNFTVAVKRDGTVVCTGTYSDSWGPELDTLRDVVSIVSGGGIMNSFKAALHSDGTVTYINSESTRKLDWTNIVQICGGSGYLIGLRDDGTVVATGVDTFHKGCLDVEDWTGITFISTGQYTTFGVKADGTVVATGEKAAGKLNVGDWTDIVAVAGGGVYTVGLRKDGTLVGTGLNGYGQMDFADWRDIVAVSVNPTGTHTVALRRDGTVLATGNTGDGRCDVDGWTGITLQ
ncbi:hypothetical protein D7X94_09825 [Acutalibacter sp. 1XD8-33]|uniref:RCC1 domain-containing protein n=1 Tax=Acutalibacter sp. 1XD8-33 TaxID=2320081 RepID=UPI000EA32042|nr:hypothetical protein [Acutalibacter sp. 1XD8-33]RKJ39921.1 hypothetical protein D7X94_09825 [Acutalibacter sp. 1XD8-33]